MTRGYVQILSSILPITLPITLPTCRYASPRSLNTLTVCRYTSQTLFPRTATLVHAHAIPPQSATVLSCVHTNTRRPIHAAPGFKPYRELQSIQFTLRTRTATNHTASSFVHTSYAVRMCKTPQLDQQRTRSYVHMSSVHASPCKKCTRL